MPSQWSKGLAALTGGGGDEEPAEAATITQSNDDGGVTFENDSEDDLDFAKAGGTAFGLVAEKNTQHEPPEGAKKGLAASVEPLTALASQAATLAHTSKRPSGTRHDTRYTCQPGGWLVEHSSSNLLLPYACIALQFSDPAGLA
mmetsp:Transcript_27704/g.50480  ORF Transcript_27704/g.50480 Transcript_27704/m.50480 type:complete len:144 (+) Transcript_27704:120-551(+)|eukprot:CAMPEP_0201629618 /NCGR_PEP_ID=MMETSP0493-20130528/4222_1 /ASSEMBLY_ACC=CAM_ASM_000838 /TAXON_ID=420259 /ORGANISM="Thalassiosira gravida, Strain GMp14c1" /LENGTH=143 /DNA_ID=CAMNT_0048100643 /DNA_START=270 /DNA_END=701 /DNA_ORIENTATION=+